jgi:hypothetical protein
MLTLKASSSGWTAAHDAYNGLANFPVSQPGVREHFCNYCPTRILTVYHADVRPSRALTMDCLADLRSSDVSPGSGQTSQYKPTFRYRSERPGVALGSEPRPLPTGSCPGGIWCLMGPQRDEHGAAGDGLFCRYFFLHDIQMLYEFSTNNAKDVGARRRVQ